MPRVLKELVEGGTPVPQARETVEQLGDIVVSRVTKETAESVKLNSQVLFMKRIVDVNVPQLGE